MKSYGHLYQHICSFENLLAAARKAEKCRRYRHDVGRFRTNVERELLQLREELVTKTYRPGGYTEFWIAQPKRRMISAAPYRDRVVHHAVCNVVMPLFERKMSDDLYSNREGRGTHAAIRRCQHFCRRFRYVLKCDIEKYFPSIDHGVLKAQVRRTVRCANTLWLMDTIIDASNRQEPVCTLYQGDDMADAAERRVGLPIGNLTSQWLGGVYLTAFDHWVRETLYVDDFLLFADDKRELLRWRDAITVKLAAQRVRLNMRKCRAHRTADGVTFLGQRVWPFKRRLRRENVMQARRRLRWYAGQYCDGTLPKAALVCRWMSWRGHALQADTCGLVNRIRDELRGMLRRGVAGTSVSRAAGRELEQQCKQHPLREPQQQQPGQHEQQQRVSLCEGDSRMARAMRGRTRVFTDARGVQVESPPAATCSMPGVGMERRNSQRGAGSHGACRDERPAEAHPGERT